jgi:hypothetical protein
LFEIGIGGYDNENKGGNSLRMWKNFFPFGKIFAIDIYNKSGANILSNLTIDTNLINNLVTTTIDIIEKANNNNKNLPLETFITKAIFNALDKKQPIIQPTLPPVNNNQNFTLERLLSKAIFNALDKSQTNSPLVSPSTMTGIVNSGNPSQSMFLNSFLSSNNKYSVILKNTQNGICEDLNKIVSEIAENVCKLITEQFVNTQTGSTSGTGTTKPSGIVSMQKSIPCPNPIPVDYQLLGTYDNTDLRYNDKINTFCTNNSTQSTPPIVINPSPKPNVVNQSAIAGNPMQSKNLNTLVNIAVDVIDNIKNQNTNIHNLVNAAVDIILTVK